MDPFTPTETPKVGPKDMFLHLLAIITLYFSAGSFLALVFQIINLKFPDALEQGYYATQGSYGAIRFAISSLIIIFPVYLLTTGYLNKAHEQNPEKRNLRSRRWLLYLTLFIAALIIIGDLVALINHLLGGELTVRFILKVITVLFVAASVFCYYHWDLKRFKTG